jgi:hypothetical protein
MGKSLSRREMKELMGIPEVEEEIRKRLPILIQRMFDLAEGVLVQEVRLDKESGEMVARVYRQPPDRQALQFLIENVIGKTPQRIELTGRDGNPVEIIPWMPTANAVSEGLLEENERPRLKAPSVREVSEESWAEE